MACAYDERQILRRRHDADPRAGQKRRQTFNDAFPRFGQDKDIGYLPVHFQGRTRQTHGLRDRA